MSPLVAFLWAYVWLTYRNACAQDPTERRRRNPFLMMGVFSDDLRLDVEDVHARIVEERAQRRVAAVCVIAAREAELEPISESLTSTEALK